ncbi:hypothetical protein RRG08_048220 [Elysia crispata]|uniref:Uncharacterized protein n=1 Tax=Elysia crispata TaxID=231223 RepID=A0AAE0XZ40_9GAST|nr:hypothetical protein RRG08_048220 [Elysia crispata]
MPYTLQTFFLGFSEIRFSASTAAWCKRPRFDSQLPQPLGARGRDSILSFHSRLVQEAEIRFSASTAAWCKRPRFDSQLPRPLGARGETGPEVTVISTIIYVGPYRLTPATTALLLPLFGL